LRSAHDDRIVVSRSLDLRKDRIMSKATPLTRAGVSSVETLVRRILATFDRATASDLEAGATWYDEAGELARDLAANAGSVEHAAAVIAHLSPRSTWTRNVLAATALILKREMPPGVMSDPLARATDALDSADPLATLNGPKTARFARNILGDVEAVTVDVWAARVAGISERQLASAGVYDLVEHAYRLAARRRGVNPSTMQATTWVVARGGRAS
jgi:hypothetical protein